MAVKGRREEYAETTRAAIVAAAIERFTVDGFAKTSIDAVAESARVSKGAVYHHFADKSELFEATFIVMEERLLTKVIVGVTGIADAWDIVRAGVDAFLTECGQPDFRRIAREEAPAAGAGPVGRSSRRTTSWASSKQASRAWLRTASLTSRPTISPPECSSPPPVKPDWPWGRPRIPKKNASVPGTS